jgi:signal transduction histidine kinase
MTFPGNIATLKSRDSHRVERIRLRVLLPLTFAIILLFGVFTLGTFRIQKEDQRRENAVAARQTQALFAQELENSSDIMRSTISALMQDKELQYAFETRDRRVLLERGKPLLAEMNRLHGISHFYFHLPNRVNLLRIHEPDHSGDKINRATILEAERTGHPSTGIERGPSGLFVLRTVVPWRSGGHLIGYLEMGKELTNVAQNMHGLLQAHVIVSVYKKFLDRAQWEKNKPQIGSHIEWDQFPNTVVMDKDISEIPTELVTYLKGSPITGTQGTFTLSSHNKVTQVTLVPLTDLSGRTLGDLIIARDVSASAHEITRAELAVLGMCLIVGSALLISFYIFLGRVERTLLSGRQELESTNRTLSQEIEERAKTEVLLLRAKEEAEVASAAKNEFLSRVSHELRTPMNAILGFGQVLETQELTPRQTKAVTNILKAGSHLLKLINEVLDISRAESGNIAVSEDVVSLDEMLRRAFDLIRPVAKQHEIHLSTSGLATARGQYVAADEQRLMQVLLNLVANAVKYNRPGGCVQISCEPKGTDHIRINVTDTGQGISKEDLEKLFVPFERLRAGQTQIEGTGLGLALSKRLVEAMGGTIGATSVIGEGSTFYVELRRTAAPEEEQTQDLETAPHSGTCTVLAIEDNQPNYWLLEEVLKSLPEVSLMGAIQGSMGLDLAKQHRPDLILLDLHLPDMTGHDVLRALRADAMTRDIPVVVLSADATRESVERLTSAGIQHYLTKPLDVALFLSVVQEYLRLPVTA